MGLKNYDQPRMNTVEVAQLIILYTIFSARESSDVIFQGGTAIKWFLGGPRFSEDLDFVTHMGKDRVRELVHSMSDEIRRQMIAHYGPGEFSIKDKSPERNAYKAFVEFQPHNKREKIAVKVEFEKLTEKATPEYKKMLLSASPAVSYFIQKGDLKIAPLGGGGGLINVETLDEIFSDKLRALMERKYVKGRDYFDIWFLAKTLGATPNAETLKRKLDIYKAPFTPSRGLEYFTNMDNLGEIEKKELVLQIDSDLSRFIQPDFLATVREGNFKELLAAVQKAFQEIEASGFMDLSRYAAYNQSTGRKP